MLKQALLSLVILLFTQSTMAWETHTYTLKDIGIIWQIQPQTLKVDGYIQINKNNAQTISFETALVIVEGLPQCYTQCEGRVSIDGHNNIYVSVPSKNEDGRKELVSFGKIEMNGALLEKNVLPTVCIKAVHTIQSAGIMESIFHAETDRLIVSFSCKNPDRI